MRRPELPCVRPRLQSKVGDPKIPPINPVGKNLGKVTLADGQGGLDRVVFWNGENNVISYVKPSSFNVRTFFNDVLQRGKITDCGKITVDQYNLTSIQAGFEPWRGGVGLTV
jgi:Glycosyl hydrolase family 12